MKATLFNNDIEKYAEALQRKGEYELGDATIKKVDEEYASRPNECSLVINARAKILPLIDDPEKLAPEYQAISTIPRDPNANSVHGNIFSNFPLLYTRRTSNDIPPVKISRCTWRCSICKSA